MINFKPYIRKERNGRPCGRNLWIRHTRVRTSQLYQGVKCRQRHLQRRTWRMQRRRGRNVPGLSERRHARRGWGAALRGPGLCHPRGGCSSQCVELPEGGEQAPPALCQQACTCVLMSHANLVVRAQNHVQTSWLVRVSLGPISKIANHIH